MELLNCHNIEAERRVLCSCIISKLGYTRVAGIIKPKHFYEARNRIVFEAIEIVYNEYSQIDDLSIIDELTKKGKIDSIGGVQYITGLMAETSSAAESEKNAGIVKE